MNLKYSLLFIMIWPIFQPFGSISTSLSTKVRITAVKGIVTTELVNSENDSKVSCPLKRTLNVTESRVINGKVRVKTGNDSYALIEYRDHSKIKIAPNTEIVLQGDNIYIQNGNTWFKIEKQKDGHLIVKTPTVIAGIRGTEFTIKVAKDGTSTCRLIKGSIEISDISKISKMMLSSGMEVTINKGSSTLDPVISNIKKDDKWWTDWPKLVPISEMPSYPNNPIVMNNNTYSTFQNAFSKPCGTDKEFIRSLYQSILDRDMEDVSFKLGHGGGHLQNLRNGDSRWKLIYALFNSTEYKNKHKSHIAFIRDAYQSILGREPADKEIGYWPKVDRGDILRKFFNSDEYHKLLKDCESKGHVISPVFTGKDIISFPANVWNPHTENEGQYSIGGNLLCINSMKPGGAWFTTSRPYGFDKDYTVEFETKLNTADNHWPILFSDGFVYIHIDWGTTLGCYQPGASYNEKTFTNLSPYRWYKIKVEAKPSQGKFDVYLDNSLLGTATNVKPLHSFHTGSPQINDSNIIWFGDADSNAYSGGRYNRGNICWRNIIIKQTIANTSTNNTLSVSGTWHLDQDNGYTGNMNIQQDSNGHFSGNVLWNGYLKGTISGQILGNAISITIDYHNGDIGYYNGTLTTDGNKIINGTVKGNNGVSANWTGTKIISHSNYNQKDNIWALNSDNFIYKRNGGSWEHFTGMAQDIGVGAYGSVWITGTENHTYGGTIYRLEGSQFVKTAGQGVRIDVDPNGNPWGINNLGHIYKWQNNAWCRMPGLATDIGIGADGTVWIIGTDAINSNYGIYKWDGSRWHKYPGAAVRIDVDPNGNPWVVNSAGDIFKYTNNNWQQFPGKAKDITIDNNGYAWIIGKNPVLGGYDIYKWIGNKWLRILGGATNISVGGF